MIAKNETIYCYPPKMEMNEYFSLNSAVWEKMGFSVTSFRKITSKILKPFSWNRDLLILNFFENLVVQDKRLIKLGVAVLYLLFAKIVVRKIIWVRHNYKPHDMKPGSEWYYDVICKIMYHLANEIVAHREVDGLNITKVVPHPLYRKINMDDEGQDDENNKKDYVFLYFGLVRAYKGLPSLLSVWPQDKKLTMLGYCQDIDLTNEINSIIYNRKILVSWENSYIEASELDSAILNSDYVVIPHVDNSMIVTGAIFHAMSLGANVLVNKSDFSAWATNEYPFVHEYNNDELQAILCSLNVPNKKDVLNIANQKNSDKKISDAWNAVFNS